MRKWLFTLSLLSFSCIFLTQGLHAQTSTEDSTKAFASNQKAQILYFKTLGRQAELYSGIEYVPFLDLINEGQPYFGSDKFDTGQISYHGINYLNVPILYDLVQEALLIPVSEGQPPVELYNELVDSFSVSGHHFIRLVKEDGVAGSPQTGFYEQLYQGRSWVLKKEEKSISKTLNETGAYRIIKDKVSYYIKKDGRFYEVKGKGSVLNVLSDKKKDLKKYISSHNIRLSDNMDEGMVRLLSYYDGNGN
jgi:hypothetical protein